MALKDWNPQMHKHRGYVLHPIGTKHMGKDIKLYFAYGEGIRSGTWVAPSYKALNKHLRSMMDPSAPLEIHLAGKKSQIMQESDKDIFEQYGIHKAHLRDMKSSRTRLIALDPKQN